MQENSVFDYVKLKKVSLLTFTWWYLSICCCYCKYLRFRFYNNEEIHIYRLKLGV